MARLVPPVLPAGTLADRPQPRLAAARGLKLRPWLPSDAPALSAAFEDPGIQHWHHRTMERGEALRWIVEASAGWYRETDADWAVVAQNGLVGRVALRGVSLLVGQAEVSYWTVPQARAAGIALRAVDRLSGWALDEVGFWRLEIRHSTANEPSCRVAEAAGFSREAVLARSHIHADGWHDVHVHTRFRSTGLD